MGRNIRVNNPGARLQVFGEGHSSLGCPYWIPLFNERTGKQLSLSERALALFYFIKEAEGKGYVIFCENMESLQQVIVMAYVRFNKSKLIKPLYDFMDDTD